MKEIFTFITRHLQISGMLLYVLPIRLLITFSFNVRYLLVMMLKVKYSFLMIITVLIIVLIYSNRGFVLIYYIVGTKSIIMKCKT